MPGAIRYRTRSRLRRIRAGVIALALALALSFIPAASLAVAASDSQATIAKKGKKKRKAGKCRKRKRCKRKARKCKKGWVRVTISPVKKECQPRLPRAAAQRASDYVATKSLRPSFGGPPVDPYTPVTLFAAEQLLQTRPCRRGLAVHRYQGDLFGCQVVKGRIEYQWYLGREPTILYGGQPAYLCSRHTVRLYRGDPVEQYLTADDFPGTDYQPPSLIAMSVPFKHGFNILVGIFGDRTPPAPCT